MFQASQARRTPVRCLVAAIATSVSTAAPVAAPPSGDADTAMRLDHRVPTGGGGIAGVDFIEDFEFGFDPGNLIGQGGWDGPGGRAIISDIAPLGGTLSARHLSGELSPPSFELNSPAFPSGTQFGRIAADIRISGNGSTYDFIPQDLEGGQFFNTRVRFDPAGDVLVAQVNADESGFEYIDTGATWGVGLIHRVCVELVDANGELNVFLDGELIFTGEDTTHRLTGASNGIGAYLTYCDNEGHGFVNGTGDTYTIDNFSGECEGGGPPPPPGCEGDTDSDGTVGVGDLIDVVVLWGTDGQDDGVDADLNDDGTVNVTDLIIVVTNWGDCPLVNDTCDQAFAIGAGAHDFSNAGAGLQPDPPFSCGAPSNDVWFSYTVTCTGTVVIDTIGSEFDTVLEVYLGSGCPPGASLACDDDGGGGTASQVVLDGLAPGSPLKIRVGGSGAGSGTISISCTPTPPSNDECVDAIEVELNGGTTILDGSTLTATFGSEAAPCGGLCPNSPDVWYTFQGTGNIISIGLCDNATDFDTLLTVYCGSSCGNLGCIDADDDFCVDHPSGASFVQFCSSANQTYWVNVQGVTSSILGSFVLEIDDGVSCGGPAPCLSGNQGFPNDDCVDAVVLPSAAFVQENYDNTGACTNGSAHAGCQHDGQTYQDIWYLYTAACDGDLVVSTCNSANYDTDLVVYDATGWPAICTPGDDELIACNDDGTDPETGFPCGGFSSYIEIENVRFGDEFLIRVGGFQEGSIGEALLTVECSSNDNDFCESATELGPPGNPGGFPSTITESTCGATDDDPSVDCGNGFANNPGRWYVVEGDGTEFTASLCSNSQPGWNSRLTVFCGTCDALFCDLPAMFEEIDNCPGGNEDEFDWCTEPGARYLILVHSQIGCGEYTLEITSNGTPCASPVCVCEVDCVGNEEPEACGESVNAGCNAGGPDDMTPLLSGDTVCGEVWADGGSRDTDWYKVTLGPSAQITATITSDIPVVVTVLRDILQNCSILTPLGSDHSGGCGVGEVTVTGFTGEVVYIFVAPDDPGSGPIFDGFPCGTVNDYQLDVSAP